MQRSGFEEDSRHPVLRCESQSTLLNWEALIRSMPVMMRLPDLRHPMFELHTLFEFIRSFCLLRQLLICLTRSRWVFESYALAVRVLRLNIGAYQFVRLQGTNVIQIFFISLNRTGPVLRAMSTNEHWPSRDYRETQFDPFFFPLRTGKNLYDAAAIFGSDSGGN